MITRTDKKVFEKKRASLDVRGVQSSPIKIVSFNEENKELLSKLYMKRKNHEFHRRDEDQH